MKKIISVILAISFLFSVFIFVAAAEMAKPFYLVLGDSIAYGSGLKNPEEACYGRIVADTNGYDYKNLAVSGQKSSELIDMLKNEEVLEDVKSADVISISIGGNDFLGDNVSDLIFDAVLENDLSDFDETAGVFSLNINQIISTIIDNNSDAVILLQTLYNPQSGELKELYQQGVDRLNIVIHNCESGYPENVYVVDVASVLNGNEENFAKDGIHPSAKGNELIAAAVLEKLHSLGLGVSTEPVVNIKGKDIREPIFINLIIKILIRMVKTLAYFYNLAK